MALTCKNLDLALAQAKQKPLQNKSEGLLNLIKFFKALLPCKAEI
jgi:hypothetical protein